MMTIEEIKEMLHNHVNEAHDPSIIELYKIFEDKMTPDVHWLEDKEFVAELDERMRRYEEGIDPFYTIEESKASLVKMKQEYYKKEERYKK